MRFGLRELIFVLLLLAVPVASYVVVFKPRAQKIAEAREEIRQRQAKLKQLETATRTIKDLDREIQRLEEAIQLFEEKLPAQREVEVVLRQVWEMARRQRLMPRSVRTDKPVPTARYSELPIRMSITGNFDGFYSFLLELERLPRITRIPKLELKRAGRGPEGELEVELVLSVFFDNSEGGGSGGSAGKERL